MKEYKRGQIWIANLPNMGGSIQAKTRPVLIVSNNLANRYSPVVHICPISTSKISKPFPTHVMIGKESGLLCESIVLCEQSMLVNKNIFQVQIGFCKNMEEVNMALMVQLGIVETKNKICV